MRRMLGRFCCARDEAGSQTRRRTGTVAAQINATLQPWLERLPSDCTRDLRRFIALSFSRESLEIKARDCSLRLEQVLVARIDGTVTTPSRPCTRIMGDPSLHRSYRSAAPPRCSAGFTSTADAELFPGIYVYTEGDTSAPWKYAWFRIRSRCVSPSFPVTICPHCPGVPSDRS